MSTEYRLDDAIEVRRFSHGEDWEARLFLVNRGSDRVMGHAEAWRHGQYMCRIVLAGIAPHEETALHALELKAIDWIDDWRRREHSGDTGFSDL